MDPEGTRAAVSPPERFLSFLPCLSVLPGLSFFAPFAFLSFLSLSFLSLSFLSLPIDVPSLMPYAGLR